MLFILAFDDLFLRQQSNLLWRPNSLCHFSSENDPSLLISLKIKATFLPVACCYTVPRLTAFKLCWLSRSSPKSIATFSPLMFTKSTSSAVTALPQYICHTNLFAYSQSLLKCLHTHQLSTYINLHPLCIPNIHSVFLLTFSLQQFLK